MGYLVWCACFWAVYVCCVHVGVWVSMHMYRESRADAGFFPCRSLHYCLDIGFLIARKVYLLFEWAWPAYEFLITTYTILFTHTYTHPHCWRKHIAVPRFYMGAGDLNPDLHRVSNTLTYLPACHPRLIKPTKKTYQQVGQRIWEVPRNVDCLLELTCFH